jgi:hypothetical protein
VTELKEMLARSGFVDIVVEDKDNSDEIIRNWNFGDEVEKMVFSAYIRARKPSA